MQPTSSVCPFVLDAIEFLERNDFTDIYQMEEWLLYANDGKRHVYIWLGGWLVPVRLIMRAQHTGARLDLLAPNEDGHLRHVMNVDQ